MKRAVALDDKDIALLRTLLWQHHDFAFRKRRTYESCNFDGSYNRTIVEYGKLISRFKRLLSLL